MAPQRRPVYREPGFFPQFLCALIGSMWGPAAGTFLGYVSVALPSFDKNCTDVTPFKMGESEQSLFTSVPFLAAIPGSLVAGLLTAKFGRRNILRLLLLPIAATWAMIAFGGSFAVFLVARVVVGFCAGMAMPAGQLYLVEISSPGTRGFITTSTMLFQLFYGLVNYAVGSLVSWQALALVNAAIHVAHLPLTFYVPESPVWLAAHGREAEARKALEFLRDARRNRSSSLSARLSGILESKGTTNDPIKSEFEQLKVQVERSRVEAVSFRDIFQWNYLKPVIILCVFAALRQFTGAFAIISYTVDIFESAGGAISPRLSTVIVGFVQLSFVILSNSITDKVGRKRLIVGSAVTMGLAHGAFGWYEYMYTHEAYKETADRLTWIPLVALIVFSVGFSSGFASALFVLMGELIPYKIKAPASGVASIVNHATNFMVLEFYFPMKRGLTEAGTFWFYGAVCFVAAVYSAVLVPETKGKSLEELEEKLTGSRRPSDVGLPQLGQGLDNKGCPVDDQFLEVPEHHRASLAPPPAV